MKFPTIATPTYEVKLLSREKPVKFRPFLVKEQKLMMMVAEEKSLSETNKIIKQIASNCILDPEVNVDELPLVDIELLFLNFRARSMGEMINTYFKCKNKVNNVECGMVIETPINLLEVPVVNKDVEKKIMVTDSVGVQMKYPTFDIINQLSSTENSEDPDIEFKAAAMNIDFIFDKESVYYAKDAELNDLLNFIYSMPPEKYQQIENFFDKIPTVRKELQKTCPKCSYEHSFVLEGLNDFFY